MKIPFTEPHPDDPDRLPPARRRRAGRLLAPLDANERAAFLDELGQRNSLSFDFFLFSLWGGLVITIGLLVNSPAILVLAAVMTPYLAPLMAVSLGTVIGSIRFFLRSLVGLVIGGLLVVAISAAGGYIARAWLPLPLTMAHLHAQLSWPDFVALTVSAALAAVFMVSSDHNPAVPGVVLAYELYLPLAAAGLGLGSGVPHLWPDGLVVFALHLAWGALFAAFTLAVLGFRPMTLFGYTLGGAMVLLGLILLIGASGAGAVIGAQIGLPTPVPSPTLTLTPSLTPSATPIPPTRTLTPTPSKTPTPTATFTPTATATPVLAVVKAISGDGAILRSDPGGKSIGTLLNNTLVQVLPEVAEKDGQPWVHVLTFTGIRGWILQQLLLTPTPAHP